MVQFQNIHVPKGIIRALKNVRPDGACARRDRRSRVAAGPLSPPIANIKLIENPAQNFLVIMKDGTSHRNTVV
jgi:hypothetical protein